MKPALPLTKHACLIVALLVRVVRSSGLLRDQRVPLSLIFGTIASAALTSVVLVVLIKPRHESETK